MTLIGFHSKEIFKNLQIICMTDHLPTWFDGCKQRGLTVVNMKKLGNGISGKYFSTTNVFKDYKITFL